MTIPGFTSTGSKRPEALFGEAGAPVRMVRAAGCRVWDEEGREYLDTVMALGAVALGYGYPPVTLAAEQALRDGTVGSLAPVQEPDVAERLAAILPGVEGVRFLKTGAEAVAAAVRLARVVTGRDGVVTCGYAGWLDWCQEGPGVPDAIRALRRVVPFNDVQALERAFDEGPPPAALVLEPLVDDAPEMEWLAAARRLCDAVGTVLVLDEIKTAFRVARGGIAEALGVTPDLIVVGKALGNGLPLAAVGGRRAVMEAATRTWISSTLATEMVSLAAAAAVLDAYEHEPVVSHLLDVGTKLYTGLSRVAGEHAGLVRRLRGVPQMCYLEFRDAATGGHVAQAALARGLLFKRSAYNFVSYAHDPRAVDQVVERLHDALAEVASRC